MIKIFPLMVIVFLAAFLLFQIELMVAKAILPTFGGSYLVWSVCVMFFQGVLLLGYLYAHIVSRAFGITRYYRVHLALLSLTLLFLLGGMVGTAWQGRLPFVIQIVYMLALGIGPLFLALSTTSIIIQSWLGASDLPRHANPYILYGISNLGSFAALLSYPFFFEPLFDLKTQWDIWRILYLILVILHFALPAYHVRGRPGVVANTRVKELSPRIPKRQRLAWLLFSSAACAMFLSVTNVITLDLASVPFLWILPLSIYLLSFTMTFKQNPWYPDWIRDRFYLAVPVGVFLFLLLLQSYKLPILFLLPLYLGILFIFCMVCNGELYRIKPSGTRNLTSFYLTIAIGGLAGSTLVSWVVPLISTSLIEYVIGYLLAAAALSLDTKTRPVTRRSYLLALSVILLMILWPVLVSFSHYHEGRIIAVAAGIPLAIIFFMLKQKPRAVALALLGIICVTPFIDFFQINRSLVYKHRNFYGIYRVFDKQDKRVLMHGSTKHGAQYLDPARHREALAYYHVTAPSGELMSSPAFNFQTTGIIGLGTGSLSVYTKPGQSVDFFELDPDNGELADRYFTYLRTCAGNLRIIFGDGRLSLSRVRDNLYDLLVVDAFNSDSIPVHLLTVEAIEEYLRCLKDDGIILFHISNHYLNLESVLYANARALSIEVLGKSNHKGVHSDAEASIWVALTPSQETGRTLIQHLNWTDLKSHPPKKTIRPWTDRYSNLLAALLAKTD